MTEGIKTTVVITCYRCGNWWKANITINNTEDGKIDWSWNITEEQILVANDCPSCRKEINV